MQHTLLIKPKSRTSSINFSHSTTLIIFTKSVSQELFPYIPIKLSCFQSILILINPQSCKTMLYKKETLACFPSFEFSEGL